VDEIIPYITEQENIYEGIASILVGDFNATPLTTPIRKLTLNGTDSIYYDTFHKIHPYGNPGNTVPSNSPDSRIDYIFLKNNCQFDMRDSYVTMNETYAPGKYCSDHLGVITIFKASPVDVSERSNIVNEFRLEQNYPNPFNPSTTINYSIPFVDERHASHLQKVILKVYDILGREVVTLVNKEQSPGNYSVKFDASTGSATATQLNSGIYFYKLHTSLGFTQTRKMLLIK